MYHSSGTTGFGDICQCQFRHYLYSRPFFVRTDHSSLSWIMHFKGADNQLARWLEELQSYNMQVVHCKGKDHTNVDALSRIPDTLEYCDCYKSGVNVKDLPCGACSFCVRTHEKWYEFDEEVDDVAPLALPIIKVCHLPDSNWADCLRRNGRAEEQERDSNLRVVRHWLKNHSAPSREELIASSPEVKLFWANRNQLKLVNDVLMYEWKGEEDKVLLVVPAQSRDLVLRLGHNNSLSGHFGAEKTLGRLRRNFYWPRMSEQVEQYIRGCFACNRSKHLRRRYRAPLREFTAGAPMEKVHIDILGPLPETPRKNKYVLLAVDQFSKWIEGVALPDQKAETIADAMVNQFFSRMGCPMEIVSDRGTNFCSQLFSDLCQRLGISRKLTTAFRPSANGQVERMNRSLLQMIRCHLMETFSRHTPNMLMLGREVRQPLELMMGRGFTI